MKKTLLLALCASSLGLGACGLDIPDLNNPSKESFTESPTPVAVNTAATGLLIGNRAGISAQPGYVAHLGILGRESFTYDAADPRYISEMVRGSRLDPGSPAFGASNWTNPYANIANTNNLLVALGKVAGMTEQEKKGITGFAKTIQALDFLIVINTRDTNGAPIDVGGGIYNLGPIETKERVFEHIVSLLEEGKVNLEGAGDSFSFPLSNGYAGFSTPATFLRFNRALLARVQVYRGDFGAALTALQASFIDDREPLTLERLNLGVYHAYSTNSGDVTNGLNATKFYANPTLVTDAEKNASGAVDARVTRKIRLLPEKDWLNYDASLKSQYGFTMYSSTSAPVPIIRNEELILLRAEANIGLGTDESIQAAIADINRIRGASGGLEPRTDLDRNNLLDELLKQKRYSLLFEGGHRWIDLRRYNKLDTLSAADLAGGRIHTAFPLPQSETDARR